MKPSAPNARRDSDLSDCSDRGLPAWTATPLQAIFSLVGPNDRIRRRLDDPVVTSPRCAGRQCMNNALPGLASDISVSPDRREDTRRFTLASASWPIEVHVSVDGVHTGHRIASIRVQRAPWRDATAACCRRSGSWYVGAGDVRSRRASRRRTSDTSRCCCRQRRRWCEPHLTAERRASARAWQGCWSSLSVDDVQARCQDANSSSRRRVHAEHHDT